MILEDFENPRIDDRGTKEFQMTKPKKLSHSTRPFAKSTKSLERTAWIIDFYDAAS